MEDVIMEDWSLTIFLTHYGHNVLLNFRFKSKDDLNKFVKLYVESTTNIETIRQIIVTEPQHNMSFEIDKLDGITWSLISYE